MSLTSPLKLHRHLAVIPEARDGHAEPVEDDDEATPETVEAAPTRVRIGSLGLGSAAAYLLLWMLVLLGVQLLVFWGGYAALDRLGVLSSVSRAAATVLGDPVPASGVLPALEFSALLPWALIGSGALAVLWLVGSLAVVLVHNCICAITGGPRVRLR